MRLPWQRQEVQSGSVSLFVDDAGSDGSSSEEESCAWCLAEQGIVLSVESHGICLRHSVQLYQAYQQERGRRGGKGR
jgi:hypothetical protein